METSTRTERTGASGAPKAAVLAGLALALAAGLQPSQAAAWDVVKTKKRLAPAEAAELLMRWEFWLGELSDENNPKKKMRIVWPERRRNRDIDDDEDTDPKDAAAPDGVPDMTDEEREVLEAILGLNGIDSVRDWIRIRAGRERSRDAGGDLDMTDEEREALEALETFLGLNGTDPDTEDEDGTEPGRR